MTNQNPEHLTFEHKYKDGCVPGQQIDLNILDSRPASIEDAVMQAVTTTTIPVETTSEAIPTTTTTTPTSTLPKMS